MVINLNPNDPLNQTTDPLTGTGQTVSEDTATQGVTDSGVTAPVDPASSADVAPVLSTEPTSTVATEEPVVPAETTTPGMGMATEEPSPTEVIADEPVKTEE